MTPFYEPFKPSSFVCEPAAAFIVTKGGEVEVFSPKCSMPITTFPVFAGLGGTSSLMDDELILLGNDRLGTKGYYVSIQKPRDDLLAMKYRIESFPLRLYPHQHTSLVSKNSLAVVGGKFHSKALLSKFAWRELSLHWKNGSNFPSDFIGSCSVKIGVDVHIIFGGERKDCGQCVSGMEVFKVNTSAEVIHKMQPMNHKRVSHGCTLLTSDLVLVAGGLASEGQSPSSVKQDELYNITSEESMDIPLEKSLRRFQHALIKMDDQVFALGGKDRSNSVTSKIEVFDVASNGWNKLAKGLHSTNTSELVVSSFPISSLDCVPEGCKCGIKNKGTRIFNGNEAQVKDKLSESNEYISFVFVQANTYPWLAALSMSESTGNYINSMCSAALVYHT